MKLVKATALVSILLLGSGCGDDDLPAFSALDRLRVIALVASAPEANPGTAGITITPWVSDARGGGRALTYTAEGCLDPGVSFGSDPSCVGNPTKTSLGSGAVTGLSAPHYTSAVDTITLILPSDAIAFAGRSANEKYNGVAYLVTYEVRAADGTTHKAFKRILISETSKTAKNQNPTLSDILADGTSLTAVPAGVVQISAQIASWSAETYSELGSTGPVAKSEDLITTWFITGGDLLYDRTEPLQSTRWTPPASAPALVIGVLRDERGGSSVVAKSL